jgi:hypothetical protein
VFENIINSTDERVWIPGTYHCEIYCPDCEQLINDKIIYDAFCDIEGWVSIHATQYGKCIEMIDRESALL